MKKIIYLFLIVFVFSCNDDFLEKYPKTKITSENFFNSEKDLETYTNGLYGLVGSSYDDIGTDNIGHRDAKDGTWDLLHDSKKPSNVGGWSWDDLRDINYLFENLGKVDLANANVQHYIALGKFFRAKFYISKLKKFSQVPWYSRTLNVSDKEELYKTQDSRGLITDSIIADLNYATKYMTIGNLPKSRVTKWAAYTCLAQFALYEGCFRKYGMKNAEEAKYLTEQKANEFSYLFDIAKQASQEVMTNGGFELANDYESLFNSTDLGSSKEIILFNDYMEEERMHNGYTRLDWQYCLSQSLTDEYLKLDGSAYTQTELDTLQFTSMFKNRDNRLKATVAYPGWKGPSSSSPRIPKLLFGGYGQIKFTPKESDGWTWGGSYNDLPVYRYAEVLLINAEAHSESGTLTDDILNNTINLIRKRAGIDESAKVTTASTVDPILAKRYPNIEVTFKGAGLEIRRERRVELACEGLRWDDLMKWHVGDAILTTNGKDYNLPMGIYIPKLTEKAGVKFSVIDCTGDGVENVVIALTGGDLKKVEEYYKNNVSDGEKIYSSMGKVSLDQTIELENGDEGHIIVKKYKENPGTFVEPKYYYNPTPESQILLNENLQQNPFWK